MRRFVEELYHENGRLLQGKKVTYSNVARVSSISFIEEAVSAVEGKNIPERTPYFAGAKSDGCIYSV